MWPRPAEVETGLVTASGAGTPSASAEPGLQQRLEALEHAVQRLADANAWRKLIDRCVPAGEPVAVLADPAILPLEDLGRPFVEILPESERSAAAVARLEASRMQGIRFAVVPEAARWEVERDAHLGEHLRARFRVIAADPEAGALFEASPQPAGEIEAPALEPLIERLCPSDRFAPILDWTSLGVAQFLLGWTLFRPVDPDAGALPYLDHTIGVVL